MIVLYIILAIVALLLIVLLVNTAVKCSKARKLTPCKTEYTEDDFDPMLDKDKDEGKNQDTVYTSK